VLKADHHQRASDRAAGLARPRDAGAESAGDLQRRFSIQSQLWTQSRNHGLRSAKAFLKARDCDFSFAHFDYSIPGLGDWLSQGMMKVESTRYAASPAMPATNNAISSVVA
jgi:hypothetical protein